MKPIIIATGNPSKFEQIVSILTSLRVNTDQFLNLADLKIANDEPDIPFAYLGNPKGLVQVEGQNTMSQVKAIPGQNVPHGEIPQEEEVAYRLQYLKEALTPIINQINKNAD